jgi:hypothetical protein
MSGWTDYRACCREAASGDRASLFCPECAHPLLRCAASGCGGLVTPLGHCPACIDLRLSLEQGAVLDARLGECLEVPLSLRNNACARSLSIRKVVRDEMHVHDEVPISWERLDPGQTRAFKVATRPFEHAGLRSLKVTIVACAALDDVEERYAFSGDVAIDVEGRDADRDVTINLGGAHLGTGTMVVANSRADADRKRPAPLEARTEVPLERAERYEVEGGYRGYPETGVRLPRSAEFAYAGFPAADTPPNGPLLQRAVIRCGRNGRAREGRQDAQPNDLCLRVYDAASGELDRDASAAISRRACDLLLANDRLYVRSLTDTAVAVNGERLSAGTARIVAHGDALTLPAVQGRKVTIGVAFKVSGGLVTQVRFEKTS